MDIKAAIVHHLVKSKETSGADSVTLETRDKSLPVDELLIRAAEEITEVYGKASNGYGTFGSDENLYRFPVVLSDYLNENEDFVGFSQSATGLIADKMSSQPFATGGYALFIHYEAHGYEWLLVAMLKLKPGMGIDEETLELQETLSLDIDHLHEAARVNLGKWGSDQQPYLSFVKKRPGSSDVSQYFRDALGCTEYTDSKHHTSQAVEAVNAFCDSREMAAEDRRQARNATFEYFEEKRQNNEPVNLVALSARILDQEPEAFIDFVRDNEYEVAESFDPHKRSYRRLKRIKARIGSVDVSFDVDDLIEDRVAYDSEDNYLVIRDVPSGLADEVRKNLGVLDHDSN